MGFVKLVKVSLNLKNALARMGLLQCPSLALTVLPNLIVKRQLLPTTILSSDYLHSLITQRPSSQKLQKEKNKVLKENERSE